MPETQIPPLPKSQPPFTRRYSTIIKLLGVGVVVLMLLIPSGMITGVLSGRLQRRNETVAEITSSWGKEQDVIGPLLIVPYQYKVKTVKEVPGKNGKLELREVEQTLAADHCRRHRNDNSRNDGGRILSQIEWIVVIDGYGRFFRRN